MIGSPLPTGHMTLALVISYHRSICCSPVFTQPHYSFHVTIYPVICCLSLFGCIQWGRYLAQQGNYNGGTWEVG